MLVLIVCVLTIKTLPHLFFEIDSTIEVSLSEEHETQIDQSFEAIEIGFLEYNLWSNLIEVSGVFPHILPKNWELNQNLCTTHLPVPKSPPKLS